MMRSAEEMRGWEALCERFMDDEDVDQALIFEVWPVLTRVPLPDLELILHRPAVLTPRLKAFLRGKCANCVSNLAGSSLVPYNRLGGPSVSSKY